MYLRPLCLAMALGLQACSSGFDKANDEVHRASNERSQQAQTLARQVKPMAPLVSEEKAVRFTSRSIPLVRSAMLPSHIESVTVRYPGRHSLSTIADILTRTLGVVVLMTPDALQDPRSYAPGRGAVTAGAANAGLLAGAAVGDPMPQLTNQALQAGASRLNLTPEQVGTTFELNYSGPLAGLLDWLASQAQLRWSYEDERIVFRRVVTQYIQVKTLPGALKGSTSFSSNVSGGSSSLSSELGGDLWAALQATLPLLISGSGQFYLDTRLGMITVRDAIANVKEVERYVEQINQLFLRQVNIQVEIIQVDMNTEAQSGIDWGEVSRTLSSGAILRSSGPAFNAGSTTSGSIGLYRGDAQVLFKALERYGRVSNMYSAVLNTLHRQPVPLSVTNSKTYLRSISAGAVSTAGAVSSGPTLSVADLNTGFTLSLVPAILDSNRVLLESSIGISSTRELQQYSTGTGFGQTVLQQPNVDNFQNVQRVSMSLGETLVLLGYQYEEARTSVTDVVRDKIPASRLGVGSKKSVIILLTPSLSGS
jgi:type IVB pilus formation R64 PilN family outer membrane protein